MKQINQVKNTCETQKWSGALSFLKGVLLTLVLAFNLQALTEGEGSGEALSVEEITKECKKSVKRAEKETVGIDMASYAAMSQVTNQVSAVKGKSAKLAHQGNAGINSVLAANAAKRCTKCREAIRQCKSDCDSESQCEEIKIEDIPTNCKKAKPEYGCPQTSGTNVSEPTFEPCKTNCNTAFEECERKLDDLREECISLSNPCEQACLQAGLSSLTALKSLAAAEQLGNCEGDECKSLSNSEEGNELDIPNDLDSPYTPSSSGLVDGTVYGEGASSNNPAQLALGDLAGDKTKANKNNKINPKDPSQPNHYYGREGLPDVKASNLKPVNSKNSPFAARAGYSGNQARLAGILFNRGKKKKPYKEDEDEEDVNLDQGFSPGGSISGYSPSGSHSGGSFRSFKRDNKNKDSKRKLAGKDDSQADGKSGQDLKDTIFVITSRLIYKFCDNNKC